MVFKVFEYLSLKSVLRTDNTLIEMTLFCFRIHKGSCNMTFPFYIWFRSQSMDAGAGVPESRPAPRPCCWSPRRCRCRPWRGSRSPAADCRRARGHLQPIIFTAAADIFICCNHWCVGAGASGDSGAGRPQLSRAQRRGRAPSPPARGATQPRSCSRVDM